jgi:hypothetical protein
VEYLESRWTTKAGTYVFPGGGDDNAFGSFPNHWEKIFRDTTLADITPHVLRHYVSFSTMSDNSEAPADLIGNVGSSRAQVLPITQHSFARIQESNWRVS